MNLRDWSWRRRIATAFGGLVLLIVLAAIAVPLLVPAERWKALAFEQLEKHTQLVGSAETASVSLIPLGLKLGGLRIDDPQGVTQLDRFELDLQSAVVRAKLGSILRGAPEVEEVRLVKPRLEIRMPAPAASTPQGPAEATPTPDVAVVLALLSIEDGHVLVYDATGGLVELIGLQNRASLRTRQGRLNGELDGGFERMIVRSDSLPEPFAVPSASWDLDLEAQLDGSGGQATFDRLEVAGTRLDGVVKWSKVQATEPVLDLDLHARVDLAQSWREFLRDHVAAQPLPAPWTIDDIELTAGEVELDLKMQGTLPAFDPADPSAMLRPLRGSGTMRGAKLRLFDRSDLVSLDAALNLENAVLRIDDAKLDGALGTVEAAMSLALSLLEPLRGTARADLDMAAVHALREQWWPRFAALAEDDAVGPDEWPQLAGRVQADARFAVAADGSFDPLTAPADAVTWTARSALITAKLPTMNADLRLRDAQMRGDLRSAEVERVQIEGPGLDARAVLQLGGWPEKMLVRGSIDASVIDVDALQAAMVVPGESAWLLPSLFDRALGVRMATAQKRSPESSPPPPADLDLGVQLHADRVLSAGYTLREVRGTAQLVEQKLQVNDLVGGLGTGSITGAAGVDWTVDPPAWTSDLRASDVPASTLLDPVAGPLAKVISTSFTGTIALDGPIASEPLQVLAALTGAVEMRSREGTFAAESLLGSAVSSFLGEAAGQWRSIDFSSLTASVKVSDGRVHFDRVFLSGTTELLATGSVGLDGTPAYRLDVRLPSGVTPALGALQPVADLLRDDAGRISFGVNVSGEAKNPRVEIDLADLQRRAQSAGGDRVRNELRDRLGVGSTGEAKDELDDVLGSKLDDLLGGRKRAPAAGDSALADSAAVDTSKSLEEQAKDAGGSLLDRLKGRKKGGGGDD